MPPDTGTYFCAVCRIDVAHTFAAFVGQERSATHNRPVAKLRTALRPYPDNQESESNPIETTQAPTSTLHRHLSSRPGMTSPLRPPATQAPVSHRVPPEDAEKIPADRFRDYPPAPQLPPPAPTPRVRGAIPPLLGSGPNLHGKEGHPAPSSKKPDPPNRATSCTQPRPLHRIPQGTRATLGDPHHTTTAGRGTGGILGTQNFLRP